jgi:PAS domain S-box-containing protein
MILADYSLPGYDGLSALAAVQKHYPKTPFIFVSGSLGEERAIETLHRGATDYVIKDRLARLGPAVRRALREREEMRKREQAQKERQESEEQFRAMFEVASIGMAQADPQTRLWLRVNQKMCAITGYSTDEMLQMRVCEITHPDDRQKDREEFERVVRGEASDYRLEKRYVGKNGAVAWVNVNMLRASPCAPWLRLRTSPSASGLKRRCTKASSDSGCSSTAATMRCSFTRGAVQGMVQANSSR